jgi:glycosyl transferase family 25
MCGEGGKYTHHDGYQACVSSCGKIDHKSKSVSLDAELYYINLDKRPDRKEHLKNELTSVGYDRAHVHRLSAVPQQDGAYGCMLSHIAVLTKIAQGDAPFAIVMEDDYTFFDPEQASLQLKRAMHLGIEWNVILLSCSHPRSSGWADFDVSDDRATSAVLSQFELTGEGESCARETVSDHFKRAIDCQTTSGYIINKTYAPTLINSFRAAKTYRANNPRAPHNKWTIDTVWKPLQVRDQWLIASPVMGHQYDGYSDIVKKPTSYRDPKTGTPVIDERTQAQPAEY